MLALKKYRHRFISFTEQPLVRGLLRFLGWAFLFGIAYAQSPLFTSNQNQYFLHGLARAGVGSLSRDWLANTLDPTPVFSQLVRISYQLFSAGWIFYLFYIALMGIYFFSLVGIVRRAFGLDRPGARLILMTLLVLVHSAALRFALARGIGDQWTFVLEGGLAGQRVLGVVFQPSVFGVLLILSIYLFLSGRLALAVSSAVAAVYFHPTYLLSAGILVCAYMAVLIARGQQRWKAPLMGAAALALVLPVLLYVYGSFGAVSGEAGRAQQILVQFRIPHHALIKEWLDLTSITQLFLVACALWLTRRTAVFPLLAIAGALAIALTIVQLIIRNDALALLFPWRISVILVPISTALVLGFLADRVLRSLADRWTDRTAAAAGVACWICLVAMLAAGTVRFWIESQEKALVKEYPLYEFVRATETPQDVYLIPTKMQDFRLETGAPIYVDFKSIPYQSGEVLEWYRRILFADGLLDQEAINCAELDAVRQEGVSRLVTESQIKVNRCPGIGEIYQDDYYRVYRLGD